MRARTPILRPTLPQEASEARIRATMALPEEEPLAKAAQMIFASQTEEAGPGAYWAKLWKDVEDSPMGLYRKDGTLVIAMTREEYEGVLRGLAEMRGYSGRMVSINTGYSRRDRRAQARVNLERKDRLRK